MCDKNKDDANVHQIIINESNKLTPHDKSKSEIFVQKLLPLRSESKSNCEINSKINIRSQSITDELNTLTIENETELNKYHEAEKNMDEQNMIDAFQKLKNISDKTKKIIEIMEKKSPKNIKCSHEEFKKLFADNTTHTEEYFVKLVDYL